METHIGHTSHHCRQGWPNPLWWRYNERDDISKHQPHVYLLSHLFGHRSKKTSKLHVTGLCAGNSPLTGEFPTQWASNGEKVSIWWCHHVTQYCDITSMGRTGLIMSSWLIVIECANWYQLFQPLWPSEAILCHRICSTLAQIIAYWHQAASHYLNQCWSSVRFVAFTWEQFYKKCARYLYLIWLWKLLIKDYSHISQGPMI